MEDYFSSDGEEEGKEEETKKEEGKKETRAPRRRKADFKAFEEEQMKDLKEEFPKFKRQQYKSMVWDRWLKLHKKIEKEKEMQERIAAKLS